MVATIIEIHRVHFDIERHLLNYYCHSSSPFKERIVALPSTATHWWPIALHPSWLGAPRRGAQHRRCWNGPHPGWWSGLPSSALLGV